MHLSTTSDTDKNVLPAIAYHKKIATLIKSLNILYNLDLTPDLATAQDEFSICA